MTSFAELRTAWSWRPIPNCPGRFILEGGASASPPEAFVDAEAVIVEYRSALARDPILITAFDGGGLMSYAKPDGRYIHTLNTTEGFARKLAALGIASEDAFHEPRH